MIVMIIKAALTPVYTADSWYVVLQQQACSLSVCMDLHNIPWLVSIAMQRMQDAGADQNSRHQARVSFQRQEMDPSHY